MTGLVLAAGTRSNRWTSLVRRSNTPLKDGPLPSGQMTGDDCRPRTLLKLVEQLEGVARGAVALVHEREDRHAAAAADLEELARLGLDALAASMTMSAASTAVSTR